MSPRDLQAGLETSDVRFARLSCRRCAGVPQVVTERPKGPKP